MKLKVFETFVKFSFIAILLVFPTSSFAAGKVVKCLVKSHEVTEFAGNCLFSRRKGGSFSLSNVKKSKPIAGRLMINVYVVKKDIAEVSGLTVDGINSRWGEAKRSIKDGACWIGADFEICAW